MNIIDAGAANLLAGLQIDQLTKLRGGQMTLDQLERFNNLTPEEREERFGDWKRPKLAPETVAPVKYLKRLFENEVITFSKIKVVIYKLVEDATFQQMFGSLGEKRRCWKDKEEALASAKKHKDKLGPNGNFFELEGGFVTDVRLVDHVQPDLSYVGSLSFDYSWNTESRHRVFSLQQ